MGLLEDILNALDRIPVWRRLQGLPPEVDELKKRIAALEEKLGDKWPADVCKFCGARAARLQNMLGPDTKGNMRQQWACAECNQIEDRPIKPS